MRSMQKKYKQYSISTTPIIRSFLFAELAITYRWFGLALSNCLRGVLGGFHFHGETKEMFSYTYTSLSQQLASTKSSDKTSTTYKENCRGVTLYHLDEMCMLLLLGL